MDGTGAGAGNGSVTARQLVVLGRVQGVNFRASLRAVAVGRDVTGWVANRPDGTVEAWLEGAPGDVEPVVSWVSAGGPSAAEVLEVRCREVEPVGCEGFRVLG